MRNKFFSVCLSLFVFAGCGSTSARQTDGLVHGFDASYVNEVEKAGGVYRTSSGTTEDVFKILYDSGINLVRVRQWNVDGAVENTLSLAKRIKANDMSFMLDFHYSGTWADYGSQCYPEEWEDFTTIEQVGQAVYDYTKSTLVTLKNSGVSPDYIQLGNEIDNGMLLKKSDGTTDAVVQCARETENLVYVLNKGAQAVREVCPKAKIVIHLASMQWLDWVEKFFDGINTVDYDILGFSWYSYYDQGALPAISTNIAALKEKYGKPVLICETAYGWTLDWADDNVSNQFYTTDEETAATKFVEADGTYCSQVTVGQRNNGTKYIGASKENQAGAVKALMSVVKESGGLGVCYWGGEWIGNSSFGSNWENQALFDLNGKALPALEALGSVEN